MCGRYIALSAIVFVASTPGECDLVDPTGPQPAAQVVAHMGITVGRHLLLPPILLCHGYQSLMINNWETIQFQINEVKPCTARPFSTLRALHFAGPVNRMDVVSPR